MCLGVLLCLSCARRRQHYACAYVVVKARLKLRPFHFTVICIPVVKLNESFNLFSSI